MTKDEIIALAKEAGIPCPNAAGRFVATDYEIEKFVNVVLSNEITKLRAKIKELENPLKYNPAPVYTSNCIRHPAAPHGVDVDASWRAGKSICVCQSWAPGGES